MYGPRRVAAASGAREGVMASGSVAGEAPGGSMHPLQRKHDRPRTIS